MIKKFEDYIKKDECCKDCSDNNNKSKIKYSEYDETTENISEGLSYHIENEIPLLESIFRYGSEGFFNTINEARYLYENSQIKLSEIDKELIKTDIGKKLIFEGEEVWLDIPMIDESINESKYKGREVKTSKPFRDSSGGKVYKVYVSGCNSKTKSNPSGIKIVRFGSGGLKAKINDSDKKRNYDSRHGCSKGRHNDKCKAGYWSCRLPRYAKSLGLSGSGQWW